jgi:hypothetical protein
VGALKGAVKGHWQKIPLQQEEAPPTMWGRLFTALYGEMTPSDLLRVFWFAGTLFFIIG